MKVRNTVVLVNPCDLSHGIPEERITSHYPNLGLLTLGSSLKKLADSQSAKLDILYYDGTLFGNAALYDYISSNHSGILALCFSSFYTNFQSCIDLAEEAKKHNPEIITVLGNDHFSFLHERILTNHGNIFDYGFCGDDVVEGFSNLIIDLFLNRNPELQNYPGLVYLSDGVIRLNRENPDEFSRLPFVDYSLMDSLIPETSGKYIEIQGIEAPYIKEYGYRGTSVRVARGCWKLTGKKDYVGLCPNACDFCSMYVGDRQIISLPAGRFWEAIKNAFDQGYNYLFITADEFPTTFWPLIREMTDNPPQWYQDIRPDQRPKLDIGARGDAFVGGKRTRLDTLVDKLNVDHIFIGADGYSNESLVALNKTKNRNHSGLLEQTLETCQLIADRGVHFSVGAVITHIGITPELMDKNYEQMKLFVDRFSRSTLKQFDFSVLIPIPGSHAFSYLTDPEKAAKRAKELGLRVNMDYLNHTAKKYARRDVFDMEELSFDFIIGCCPDIDLKTVTEQLKKLEELIAGTDLYPTNYIFEENSRKLLE